MAHAKNHDYHILPPSIWPFTGAVSAFIMLFGAVLWMHGYGPWLGLIGLLVLLMRISRSRFARILARGYIELFQGTPLLMQLFLIFFGVALLGIDISPWMAAALALTALGLTPQPLRAQEAASTPAPASMFAITFAVIATRVARGRRSCRA